MGYLTTLSRILIPSLMIIGLSESINNETASFHPEKQTVKAETCRPVVMTLGANVDLGDMEIRVEKFNPVDFDYYYLFYKRAGDRRIRENKKSGSLGHYPRYKPTYMEKTLQFTISHVVEEDEGMYVISVKPKDSASWTNSYLTLVVEKQQDYDLENQVPSISSKLTMDETMATGNYEEDLEIIEVKEDKYCDLFIIAVILLVIGVASKMALIYYLWKTKKELNRIKRQSLTSLDRKGLLRDVDQEYHQKPALT